MTTSVKEDSAAVLAAIRKHPVGMSTEAISDLTGISIERVKKRATSLNRQGKIINAARHRAPHFWMDVKSPHAEAAREAKKGSIRKIKRQERKNLKASKDEENKKAALFGKPSGGVLQVKSEDRLKVEAALRDAGPVGLLPGEISARTGLTIDRVKKICNSIVAAGKAVGNGPPLNRRWSLLSEIAKVDAKPFVERVCNGTMGGVYVPFELRPFEGRPGAMDAYALPSRIGDALTNPRRSSVSCAGPVNFAGGNLSARRLSV